ncbi:sulfotransferase 1E1-like [Ptychodera flava]|uniref:sulfotransferase 1E1-like n=1 Tax=Ptychodera flava TaxID=63121 RepID=UPI00396A8FDC
MNEYRLQYVQGHANFPSPRLFKSHLGLSLFPAGFVRQAGGKIIYLSRNPKDCCTSFYHFLKHFVSGTFATEWKILVEEDFIKGNVTHGPWLKHVTSWRRYGQDTSNVLSITYEDLRTDYVQTLTKVAEFIERPVSADDLQRTTEKCSFGNMERDLKLPVYLDEKSFGATGNFFRKGAIGNWKTHFTVSQSEIFDREIDSKLKEHGLIYRYET